jgi:hypothetical protein
VFERSLNINNWGICFHFPTLAFARQVQASPFSI